MDREPDDLRACPGLDVQLLGRLPSRDTATESLKEWLRRLDHAAIFLMIAATYTPFVLIEMNTPFGLSLLAVVWGIAAVGIVLQLFAPRYLAGPLGCALSDSGLGRACGP